MSEQALRRAQLQAALNSPPPASPTENSSGSGRGSGRGFRLREADEDAEGHQRVEHAQHDEEVAVANTLAMSPTAHTASVDALGVTFGAVMIHEMPHEQRQQWEAEEARRRFAKGLLPASSLVLFVITFSNPYISRDKCRIRMITREQWFLRLTSS